MAVCSFSPTNIGWRHHPAHAQHRAAAQKLGECICCWSAKGRRGLRRRGEARRRGQGADGRGRRGGAWPRRAGRRAAGGDGARATRISFAPASAAWEERDAARRSTSRRAGASDIAAVVDCRHLRGPIYAGNALATVKSADAKKVVTVRAASIDPVAAEVGRHPSRPRRPPRIPASRLPRPEIVKSERPELTAARIVISGGRRWRPPRTCAIIEKVADIPRRGGRLLARRGRCGLCAERHAGRARPARSWRRSSTSPSAISAPSSTWPHEGQQGDRRHQQGRGAPIFQSPSTACGGPVQAVPELEAELSKCASAGGEGEPLPRTPETLRAPRGPRARFPVAGPPPSGLPGEGRGEFRPRWHGEARRRRPGIAGEDRFSPRLSCLKECPMAEIAKVGIIGAGLDGQWHCACRRFGGPCPWC